MKRIIPPFARIHDSGLSWFRSFPYLTPGFVQDQKSGLFVPTDLVFLGNAPSCFWELEGGIPYRGQEAAKKRLNAHINALQADGRFVSIFEGMAGLGKTALAWIVASKIKTLRVLQGYPDARFFEVLPDQFESKQDLDQFMLQLADGDIVFLDEVHILSRNVGPEALYHTLEPSAGTPRYPLGKGEGWIPIPRTVSWLAATTDSGELHDALYRRFQPSIRLEPPTVDDLIAILHDQKFDVHPDAAVEMALRSGKVPWQVLMIHNEGRVFAINDGSDIILDRHAYEAFDAMGLDANGLTPVDREIIRALLRVPTTLVSTKQTVYKMSEEALVRSTGMDKQTFRRSQAKLMMLGYLTIRGGQCLTEKALTEYSSLVKDDT